MTDFKVHFKCWKLHSAISKGISLPIWKYSKSISKTGNSCFFLYKATKIVVTGRILLKFVKLMKIVAHGTWKKNKMYIYLNVSLLQLLHYNVKIELLGFTFLCYLLTLHVLCIFYFPGQQSQEVYDHLAVHSEAPCD